MLSFEVLGQRLSLLLGREVSDDLILHGRQRCYPFGSVLDDGRDDEVVRTAGVELLAYFTFLSTYSPADDLARAWDLPKSSGLRRNGDIACYAEAFLLGLLSHRIEATASTEDTVHRSILRVVGLRREGCGDREESYLISLDGWLSILCTDEDGDRSTTQADDRTDRYLVERVEVESRALCELHQLRFGEGAID